LTVYGTINDLAMGAAKPPTAWLGHCGSVTGTKIFCA